MGYSRKKYFRVAFLYLKRTKKYLLFTVPILFYNLQQFQTLVIIITLRLE